MIPQRSFLIGLTAVVAALTLATAPARASSIASESFEDYAAGVSVVGDAGGVGWTGSWTQDGGGNPRATVIDTTASPMGFAVPGGGTINGLTRALEIQLTGAASSQPAARRQLAVPLAQTFYVGYLVRYVPANATATWGGGNNTFTLHLATNATSTTTLNFGLRGGNTPVADIVMRFGTGAPVTGAAVPGAIVTNQDYCLVCKMSWSGSAFTNAILWTNPPVNGEALLPGGNAALSGFSQGAISHVFWREAVLDTNDILRVDAVSIGTTWADVVPSGGPANPSPSVTLTNPVSGASYLAPASILLQATAASTNATVTNVAFYAGATLLTSAATAPYAYNWTGVAPGNYALTAVATDNYGAATTSSVVNVTVTNAPINLGTVIANDSFNYLPNVGASLNGQNGGMGWAGAWVTNGLGNNIVIADATADELSFTPTGGTTINGGSGAVDITGTALQPVAYRQLAVMQTNAFYVGSLMQLAAGTWSGTATFSIHLADSGANTSTLNFGARAGSDFMVRNGTGTPLAGDSIGGTLAPGTTYYLVARVSKPSGSTTYDQMDVWLNPGATSSNTPDATLNLTAGSGLAGISYVMVRAAAMAATDVMRLDELKVSPAWSDVVPNSPITVALTNPVSGSAFQAPAGILLQAAAADSAGNLTNVAFYAGPTLLANVTTAPYNFNWTGVPAGNYALTAMASDNNGASNVSAIVNITVTNSLVVTLTNPASGSAYQAPASVLLQASATDNTGTVTNVAFYAGTTLLAKATTAPYQYNWTGVPAGNCALTAVAADDQGIFSTSSVVNITVTNSLTVALTNPSAVTVFYVPATIPLAATASDATGTVTNVAFFAGGTLLANDTTTPYAFTWTNVAPGGYALTAVAADDQGILSTSAVVNITVVDTNALLQVQKWHPVNLAFTSTNSYVNPFTNVTLAATFTGPGGLTLNVPGFYAGGQTWIVRFAPTVEGAWGFTTTSSDTNLNNQTGALTCITNTNPMLHGTLKVDTNHVNYLIYEDGTPCFLNSFEADWLGELDFGDPNITKARMLVDIYRTNGFNGVLLQAYAYDTSWESGTTSTNDYGPPAQIIWLGSNASPDWSRMNTNYLANFDRVMDYLFQNNITAHLMLRVYNKGVKWPPNGSSSDHLYWAYLTARYQAYPNIVWDFSKEANNEPDMAYINNTCLSIKAMDAYHHLVTVHTANSYYTAYTNSACDFRTYQGGLYSSMVAARAANWPVLQSETDVGYQVGNDGGWTYNVHNSFLQTLNNELECFMAGVAVNYYYTYHSWDVVRYYEVPNGLSAYNNITTFFQGTKWSLLAPRDNLINSSGTGRHCLAMPGSEYVVYLASNSSGVTLTISGAPAGNSMTATWLDVVTGAQQTLANVGNGAQVFTNPWPDPALLHVALPSPVLTLAAPGGVPQLQWTAPGFVLQHALQINGPWSSLAPQPASPYVLSVTNGQEYFRLAWPGP